MLLTGAFLVLVATVSSAIPPPPTGDRPKPDKLYRITNFATGQFIDHSGANPGTGSNVITSAEGALDTQKWYTRFTWTQPGADYFYLQGFGHADYINVPDWESGLLVTQGEPGWQFVASPVLGVAERAYWIAGNNLATFPEYTEVITGSMDLGSQLVMELWNSSNTLQMWQFHLIMD
ncbi:hypothetical protein AURDEDRAFT_185643 [Auricularia subglabra TFB-10046 SS5]|nr:hypothetical protein AURDEDRAFT_185643 [Auricularia subglabra TFB-10046 SS5]